MNGELVMGGILEGGYRDRMADRLLGWWDETEVFSHPIQDFVRDLKSFLINIHYYSLFLHEWQSEVGQPVFINLGQLAPER